MYKRRQSYWFARCKCGTKKAVRAGAMKGGHTRSCGCLQRERTSLFHYVHGAKNRTKKRVRPSPEYTSWAGMKNRCTNKSNKDYKNYGGRGISVCIRWDISYENFLADMGQKPKGFEIERIDNNGNYEPANCKWVSKKENANNRRTNRILIHNGVSMNLTQWAGKLGIHPSTLYSRLRSGWSIERTLTIPIE